MTPNEEAVRAWIRTAQKNNFDARHFTPFGGGVQTRQTAFELLGGYLTPTHTPETRNSHAPLRSNGMFRGKPHPVLHGDRNQCPSCREHFNSTRVFEMHRAGSYERDERRCLNVAEMQARGFTCPDGFWRSPISEAGRERLALLRRQS